MTRLIDANALTDKVDKYIYRITRASNRKLKVGESAILADIKAHIELSPTIEAEPVRHGMFIGTEYDGFADGNPVYYEWKCSECGCVFEEDEPTYRYCPNCGARMDKE